MQAHGSEFAGIVHMVGPETGKTQPKTEFIVCGDSRPLTELWAIAFGIGTSEVEHVFATQTIWQVKPKKCCQIYQCRLKGVYSKGLLS